MLIFKDDIAFEYSSGNMQYPPSGTLNSDSGFTKKQVSGGSL